MQNINYDNLNYIYNMFDSTKYSISKDNLIETNKEEEDMENFLYKYGFVFV